MANNRQINTTVSHPLETRPKHTSPGHYLMHAGFDHYQLQRLRHGIEARQTPLENYWRNVHLSTVAEKLHMKPYHRGACK